MKAVVIRAWGLQAPLTIGQARRPEPGEHDVLVRVHAASVNPKDWKLNYHLALLATPLGGRRLPPLFGDDLSGVVVDRGSKVSSFAVGDAVYGMDMRLRTASLAEFAVIDHRRIARLPATLNHEQAAVMPLAAQTALQGLRKGGAKPGCKVLIIGASGGVGTFAVQIAKAMGCHVTAVCSTRNLTLVTDLGADDAIDYTVVDFREGGRRYDLVFDVTSYETPVTCRPVLERGGRFISTMGSPRALLTTLRYRASGADIVTVESYTRDLETLSTWVEQGVLRPVIDSVFDIEDAQSAYARSRTGRAVGKIAIRVV